MERETAAITAAKEAMASAVPAPYATRYVDACGKVGKANAGRTPQKCELPANP